MAKVQERNQVLQLIMQGHNIHSACNEIGYNRCAISKLKSKNRNFAKQLLTAQIVGLIRKLIAEYRADDSDINI